MVDVSESVWVSHVGESVTHTGHPPSHRLTHGVMVDHTDWVSRCDGDTVSV